MHGAKLKFMENLVIAPSYYEQPVPYVNAPSCHVNLLGFQDMQSNEEKSWLSFRRKK